MTAATVPQKQGIPWWLVLIEGIAAIILGIMFLMWPAKTSFVITPLIGIFWFVDGIFSIVGIFLDKTGWGWRLFMGIIGIFAGLYLMQSPVVGAFVLAGAFIWVIAFMGILIGLGRLIEAFQGAGWGAGLLGVISIFLGVVIIWNQINNPVITMAMMPYVAGIFLLVFGGGAIYLAFKVK